MIQIHNQSTTQSSRWIRCTIRDRDVPAGMRAWRVGDTRFALGRPFGDGLYTLDVKATLQPGQRMTLDLSQAVAETPVPLLLPAEAERDPVGYFGVPVTMGTEMVYLSHVPDGAALLVKFRARNRTQPQLVHELHVLYRPDEQSWPALLRITSSDVGVVQQTVLALDSVADFHMGTNGASGFMANGDTLATGQSRVFPFWLGPSAATWTPFMGMRPDAPSADIHALGLDRVGPMARFGPTTYPQGRFDVARWIQDQTPRMEAQVTGWPLSNTLGIAANSTQSGDQEDQGGGYHCEAFYQGGLAGIRTRWLCAISEWPKRLYHHCEPDGGPLVPERHPNLVMWQSLPHYSTGVSRDRLGILTLPTAGVAHGFFGPDDEHWLFNTLATALELTGCSMLQQELDWAARVWLMSETTDPRLSTSGPRAARARGYAGLFATHCWNLLEDRALAQRVRDRWLARMAIYQAHEPSPDVLWDCRQSYTMDANGVRHPASAALGSIDVNGWPRYSMTYQVAVGVYGTWLACKTFGLQDGVDFAVRAATTCMRASYSPSENPARVWEEFDTVGVDSQGRFATSADGRHQTGYYRHKWLPLCLVPVLFDGDAQAKLQAKSIRDALLREVTQQTEVGRTYANQPADWFPPVPQDAEVPA